MNLSIEIDDMRKTERFLCEKWEQGQDSEPNQTDLLRFNRICCIDNYPGVNVQTFLSVYYDNPSLRITKLHLKLMLKFILRSAIIMVLNNGLSLLYA